MALNPRSASGGSGVGTLLVKQSCGSDTSAPLEQFHGWKRNPPFVQQPPEAFSIAYVWEEPRMDTDQPRMRRMFIP
jgi:hypothetical protein